MVGQRTLDPYVRVQILPSQPLQTPVQGRGLVFLAQLLPILAAVLFDLAEMFLAGYREDVPAIAIGDEEEIVRLGRMQCGFDRG